MDRRTRNLFALVLVVVLAVTGGAALVLSETAMPVPDPGEADDGSAVIGVVVGVDARSLTDVRAFKLRLRDGRVLDFQLGELENADEFPPGHLAEHQATAEQVRVVYRLEGDVRYAVRLEDAGG